MSTTESDTAASAIPAPRAPESAPGLAPWTPAIPAQRGIRWLDAPPAAPDTRNAPPAGLADADLSPHRPRRARIALAIGVVLVVVATAAVIGIVAMTHRTMTVQGSLVVAGRGALVPGVPCSVTAMPGRTVTVFGSAGTVLGSAPLSTGGTAVDQWHLAVPDADACRFSFTVPDVPASDDSYRVGLDGNASDTVAFTREELTTSGAQLTYGH